jgi:hypothetical protein
VARLVLAALVVWPLKRNFFVSVKTSRLLHRSGRNQFSDPGDPPLPPYEPSAASVAYDKRMIALHWALNEKFVGTYRDRWLARFPGMPKRGVWRVLHPHGRPALGTFYAIARESGSFEAFLVWWLVCNKHQALRLLGYSAAAIGEQLREFSECGRYHVRYGSCTRTFGTAA